MKIVQILGGLGNQMFQYSLLVALRETFPDEEVTMDICAFDGYGLHNGFELDRIFNISARTARKTEIQKIYHRLLKGYMSYRIYKHLFPSNKNEFREKEASAFNPMIFEKAGNCYYDGYWQDYRYFEYYKEQIKTEFSYKLPLGKKNQKYAEKFSNQKTVSIHIRRGDYIGNKGFGGICNEQYYIRAIEYVKNHICDIKCFAIFSNDTIWCKERILPFIPSNTDIVVVDWNNMSDSYVDMRLMSCCKINIIANSSFSWWGAYLNIHHDSVVIAPKKWTNSRQTAIRQLPSWVLL